MNCLKQILALACALTILGSCASVPTPVAGNIPGSFRYDKLRPNIISLDYVAEPSATELEARQLAGKHVAKLCLSEGYRYFAVLESAVSWVRLPGTPGTMSLDPGSQLDRVPRILGNVRFFRSRPNAPASSFVDARAVEETITAFL